MPELDRDALGRKPFCDFVGTPEGERLGKQLIAKLLEQVRGRRGKDDCRHPSCLLPHPFPSQISESGSDGRQRHAKMSEQLSMLCPNFYSHTDMLIAQAEDLLRGSGGSPPPKQMLKEAVVRRGW